jgi:hypothetical protein
MARTVLAVIIAYIAMFLLVFIGFTCAYLLVGADVAFKPGSYEGSTTWIAIAFVINFVIAIIGGFICAAIARGGKAPIALAVVVLVLGLLLAVPAIMKHQTNANLVRAGNPAQMEIMQRAYWPVWVPFTFPFTGAIGVLIGGRLKRRG